MNTCIKIRKIVRMTCKHSLTILRQYTPKNKDGHYQPAIDTPPKEIGGLYFTQKKYKPSSYFIFLWKF